jgi:hypothetical protein
MAELPPGYNPAAVGALQQGPTGSELLGGRVFGVLGNTNGFGICPAAGIGDKMVLQGGVFGIANSGQKAPGILSQMGLSLEAIKGQLKGCISNENLAAMQASMANVPSMGNGENFTPSAISSEGGGQHVAAAYQASQGGGYEHG